MIKRSIALIASLSIIYFIWEYGEANKDLITALLGAVVGGLFTLIGVNISLRHTQAMNYGRFYLHFNKAQVHLNRFIRKSTLISEKLGGVERPDIRFMVIGYEYEELKKDIELTIKALNKDMESIDFENFADSMLDINENAPIEYYYDMNFIIITMISIYNSLLADSKYLVVNLPGQISFSALSLMGISLPHQKQIKLLKRRYKKIKKKMKLK